MLRRIQKIVSFGTKKGLYLKRDKWTASGSSGGFDPYTYTNGRWLHLDEQHRLARHIAFDFNKLCDKAIACSAGARDIIECVQMEGGFNRAFMLQLDNGKSVVARVPFSVAGPARLITNSEVATMEYIRKHTSIPVPAVLDWSDDPRNPIGTEYIIMSHAVGVQLHQRWLAMNPEQHMLTVKALAEMTKEMSSLKFPAYGSLYFTNVSLDESNLIRISDDFCIGPHCGTRYWPVTPDDERSYERRPPNRGPWRTHDDFCHGLIDTGVSRIPQETPPGMLEYRGTVEECLDLTSVMERVLLQLSQCDAIKSITRPMLLHHDMHKRNIFVSDEDPTKITCLIDWQSSSVEPVHNYSDETPDLCEFPTHWDETQLDEPPTEEQQRLLKDVDTCRRTWEIMMWGCVRDLWEARTTDEHILRPFRYAASGWIHGAALIRHVLMQLSARWSKELSLPGTLEYQPTAEQLTRQKALWEEYEMALGFEQKLIQALCTDADGWIPIDRWEETREVYVALFNDFIKDMTKSGEVPEDVARKYWPFDAVLPP